MTDDEYLDLMRAERIERKYGAALVEVARMLSLEQLLSDLDHGQVEIPDWGREPFYDALARHIIRRLFAIRATITDGEEQKR